MTPRIKMVLVAFGVAVATHVAVILTIPWSIMTYVMYRISAVTGENHLYHAPMANAAERYVVRPSPDLAYSVCVFDLGDGPLRITTPPSPTYLSVSGFADQTDNFFAINDQQIGEEGLELVLVAPGSAPPETTARVIESPSTTGIVWMRRVVESPEHLAVVEQARKAATCEPFFEQ